MLMKLEIGAEYTKRGFFRKGMEARSGKQEDTFNLEMSLKIWFGTIPVL